ncbi:MAG: hypothetical protein ATN35_07490 [Epulopiscium sp. Nele67-Bin004]|nr:MAG: hypothetical protein ATN35_07490 [Epulopiscium sp. Nele67-Bin004]
MRFAVIGDIHSNKPALQATLDDIAHQNVDFILSTGDLVGYYCYPNEVIDLVRKHNVVAVQGNHDEVIANSDATQLQNYNTNDNNITANASRIFTNATITDQNRLYLKAMPKALTLSAGDKTIQVVHGSPTSNKEYLYNNEEILLPLSTTLTTDILICGHTHLPYHTQIEDKHFINAGTVGKPKEGDGSDSSYIIVEVDEDVRCEIRRVSYDTTKIIKFIVGTPFISDELADLLV